MARKTIRVDYLSRVEGEGALTIRVRRGKVTGVELRIFEPPRFFEALLRGRSWLEAPDITARICGICPVAYQMSSCHALESAAGARVEGPLRDLRRLLYCGEWIESHALHVFLLHAPDFLGYQDGVSMAKDHPEMVRLGLRLKKAGNAILRLIGGREVHPVNVRLGGFYRVPSKSELAALIPELEWALAAARDTVRWTATFPFPDLERDYEFVAMRHPREYPFNEGRIVSTKGLDLEPRDYDEHFEEVQVERSNALHSRVKGRGEYLLGPIARFNLNFDRLTDTARKAALAAGLRPPCRNMFRSIIVRAVEILWAVEEALRIVRSYEPPPAPHVDLSPRAATGRAATEAPRGILYHRYRLDAEGLIEDAKIVPPTSQNQLSIESDLMELGPKLVEMPHAEAVWTAEQAIRNYDPCISCATHFLALEVVRE